MDLDISALKAADWSALEFGDFSQPLGPFWVRGGTGDCTIGFIAEPRHGNQHLDTVHGGMLMTFADVCLGYCVVDALAAANCAPAPASSPLRGGRSCR